MRDHSRQAARRRSLLLPGRRPQQHGQLTAGHRRAARHGRADLRARELAPVAEVQRDRPAARRPLRRPHHRDRGRHDRRCGAPTSSTPTSGCPMGEPPAEWDDRIDQLLPYQVNADVLAATGNPDVQVHALPAGPPQPATPRSASDLREVRASTRSRSPTRSSSRRPRSSSTRPRTASTRSRRPWSPPSGTEHASRRRARRQRPARARRDAPGRDPGGAHRARRSTRSPRWPATTTWSSPTATAPRSACWPSRAPPTPRSRTPTRSTCSAPRPRG